MTRARNPHDAWNDWHWRKGAKRQPAREIRVPTPEIGEDTRLIEAGMFVSIHFEPFEEDEDRLRRVLPTMKASKMTAEAALEGNEPDEYLVVEIEEKDWPHNWLSFDFDHPKDRLYILLSPSIRRDVAAALWDPELPTMPLRELAQQIGGDHGDDPDYPDIEVQPLGIVFYVSYFTYKEDPDDKAFIYIHRMGEEGGVEPALAVSKNGKLWLAGGSYRCPNAGIMR
jgi:hypothetical protein